MQSLKPYTSFQFHRKNKYPKLDPKVALLDFRDLTSFAGSYLQMMASLDLTKVS